MPKTINAPSSKVANFALSDLSWDDRRQLLSRALGELVPMYCYVYIRDVYDTFLVYRDYDEDASYKITYTINDDFSVEFGTPEEVVERTVYEPVKMGAFALSTQFVNSNKVNLYKNSLLFEIQESSEHFPGQGVTVTEADLKDIVANFSGATMGLQHVDTVLGDNCGSVKDMVLGPTGRQIFGTVAIPKGLDELIPAGPRKVSVEIFRKDNGTMYIPKVDLVLEPQIEAAALMNLTAFAKGEPIPVGNADTTHQQGKEKANMSTWDKIKAALTGAGLKIDDDAAPVQFGASEASELTRKAAAFDATVLALRDTMKRHAVIAFGQEAGAKKASFIDALPAGTALDTYATELHDLAKAKVPDNGGQRTTTATEFAGDADRIQQQQQPNDDLNPSAIFAARKAVTQKN